MFLVTHPARYARRRDRGDLARCSLVAPPFELLPRQLGVNPTCRRWSACSCVDTHAAMAKPPNTDSPLKQVNHAGQPKRSKLDACWHDLTHLPTLLSDNNQCSVPPPKRYFSEFFCLNPNRSTQDRALAALSNEDLLGPYKVRSSPLIACSSLPFTHSRDYDTIGGRTTSRSSSFMPSEPSKKRNRTTRAAPTPSRHVSLPPSLSFSDKVTHVIRGTDLSRATARADPLPSAAQHPLARVRQSELRCHQHPRRQPRPERPGLYREPLPSLSVACSPR